MQVREAHLDDAPAMGELHARAWEVAYAPIFDAAWLAEAARERRERWRTLLPRLRDADAVVLVAEDDGRVVGLTHAAASDEGSHGELYALYVDPDAWGSGAAGALCGEALARLAERGHDRAELWTLPEAGRARSFYERTGWRLTGRTQEYDFGDGVARLLVQYARLLPPAAEAPSD